MIFLVHFAIILMSIVLSHGIPDTYDPIPILYYPVQNIYRVSSIPVVEQMISKSAANKPTFLSVLFLCGDTKTSFFLTDFQQILPLVYLKQNIWEQIPKCRRKPYLHLIDSPSMPGSFTAAIGYKIADAALDNIRQYRLSSESLQIAPDNQDKHGVAIFYYQSALFFGNTYAAMHHFHAYNHLLISSITCEKYIFKLMMDKKTRDIDFGDIEMYFDEQHQQKLFNRFEIPLSIKWREKYPEEPEPEKEYFVPHRLVPTNDFVDDNERMATCITANIIPVWSSISKEPLKRVETFIQKLATKLHDNTLTVHTITQDILLWYTSLSVQKTPDKQYSKARMSMKNVYLNFQKKTIPVPRYILKIIGYRVPFTKTSDFNNHFQYYMIIVIQNELFGYPTRLCNEGKEPICKKNGWHVTSEEDEDNNVYCCYITDRSLQHILQNYQISGEIFNLNKTITLDRPSINPTEDDDVTEPKKEEVNETQVTARQPEEDNAPDKTQVAEKTYDAIPILFFLDRKIYTVSSTESVKRSIAQSAVDELAFFSIFFLCDGTTHNSHDMEQFLQRNDFKILLERVPTCNKEPHLSIMPAPFVPGEYSSAIGYKVSDTAMFTIKMNNLPVDPLHIASNQTDGVAIFYYKSALLGGDYYSTLHYFHGYQRSVMSSKSCDEYNLKVADDRGKPDIDFDNYLDYFNKDHQDKLFNHFDIPYNSEKTESTQLQNEVQNKDYFVPHRMVPTDDFIYDNNRKATCITSNIVPIWRSISQGPLKKVEEIIQKLADIVQDHTLTIHTLTSNQLEWTTEVTKKTDETVEQNSEHTKKVFLDFNQSRIPVPKYVLKIIGYEVPVEYYYPRYYIVIVIHNDIFPHSERLCNTRASALCQKTGWDVSTDEKEYDAMVYCCRISGNSLKSLRIQYKLTGETLNLHEVIVHDEDKVLKKTDITGLLTTEGSTQKDSVDDKSSSGIDNF